LVDSQATAVPAHAHACSDSDIAAHAASLYLANGDTVEGLLEDYPSLAREDILATLNYAATMAEEQVTPLDDLVAQPQ
jgi:uncharacterized protein DUF433